MEQQLPRVLIFPFNLLSHYVRCIELAKMYGDGYAIMFKNSEKYQQLLDAENISVFDCQDFDPEYVMACTRKFRFSWLNEGDLENILADQVQCIRQYKPAFVIGDMSPTLKMAAELTNTPFVSLINGYMSKYYLLQRPVTNTHPAALLKRFVPGDIFDRIVVKQERKAFERIHKPFRTMRQRYGLQQTNYYLDELEGDRTLICDHAAVFPQEKLPDTYAVIGPLLHGSDGSKAALPDVVYTHKKKILVSFGSSGDWGKVACLNETLFADFAILTAGDECKVLGADHITRMNFVNLNDLLPLVDLVICHGGNGTLNYAYEHSVPFIAVPSIMEQEWNALRFCEMSPGMLVTRKMSAIDLYERVLSLIYTPR